MNLFYYKYPQYNWVKEISALIRENGLIVEKFIDAPCGNGIISYWLSKEFKGAEFKLLDLDENSIKTACNFLKEPQFSCRSGDLLEWNFKNEKTETIFLLINSLYLLPEPEKVVAKIKQTSEYLIAIFPYVERVNFQAFIKKNPNYPHNLNFTYEQTIAWLEGAGLKLIDRKDVSYIAHHRLPKLPYIKSMLLKSFNLIENRMPKNRCEASYWIGIFKCEV